MRLRSQHVLILTCSWMMLSAQAHLVSAQDLLRELQKQATQQKHASWGHWGKDKRKYVSWSSHSNRLIPIYTFGISLDAYQDDNSLYRQRDKVQQLYGYLPPGTVNPQATYLDQTDVFRLQQDAYQAGKKHVVLIVFDGM